MSLQQRHDPAAGLRVFVGLDVELPDVRPLEHPFAAFDYRFGQAGHVDLDVVRTRQSELLDQLVHGENERGLTAAGETPSLAAEAEGQARLELRRLEVRQALATADADLQTVDALAQCVELAVGRQKEVVRSRRLEGDDPDVRVERRIER